MIDVENAVFDQVAGRVREQFAEKNILVKSAEDAAPVRFPAVTIVEADNSVYQKMRTNNIENAAKLLYEVNVFSNLEGFGKQEAQDIMNAIDEEFAALNFTRLMCSPVSNLQDSKIFRMLARYEAVIDKDFVLYTN